MCVQNTKSKLNKKNIKPVRLLRCCCYCLLYTTRHRTFEDQKLVVYFFVVLCFNSMYFIYEYMRQLKENTESCSKSAVLVLPLCTST